MHQKESLKRNSMKDRTKKKNFGERECVMRFDQVCSSGLRKNRQ
jgi:hypothetical protein